MKIYEASIQYSLVEEFPTQGLNAPAALYAYMRSAFQKYPMQESFWVISLNRKNHPTSRTMTALGSASEVIISPADIFRVAILTGASAIALAHQHPSGDPHPSTTDIKTTRAIAECGKLMKIPLLDHIVCGDPHADPMGLGYYSFNEHGLC